MRQCVLVCVSDRLQPKAVELSVSLLFGEGNEPTAAAFIAPVLPHGLDPVLHQNTRYNAQPFVTHRQNFTAYCIANPHAI